MNKFSGRPVQLSDEGICQYSTCNGQVPDGITMKLCTKHLQHAYAAYLLANGAQID